MDKMSLVTLLFLALPEGMLSFSIGLILMNVKPVLKKVLIFGFCFVITAFIVRSLPMMPGIHSILIVVLCSFYVVPIFRISYLKAFSAAVLAFIFVVLGESLFLPHIHRIAELTFEETMVDDRLRLLVTLPQQLFLALVAFISYRLRGFHRDSSFQKQTYQTWGD